MVAKEGATKINPNTFLSLIVHHFEPSISGGTSQAFTDEDSIVLDKGEIVSVDFDYKIDETDTRGKSARDERVMVIKIDVIKVANNDKINQTNNGVLLDRWKTTRYVDDTKIKEKFYKQICVDCRFGGEHERRIFFKNAYLEKYEEVNDTIAGMRHLTIRVKQKEDKKTSIVIAPTPTIYTPSESMIQGERKENENVRYIGDEYCAVFDKGELDGKVTGILYFGYEIEIDMNFTTEDKFVKITSPISGFVKRENLIMNKPTPDSYSKELYDKIRLSKETQYIYTLPYKGSSLSSNKIVPKIDEEITLKGTYKITSVYGGVEDTWIKCKYGNVTGWVDCGKLKPIKSENNIIVNLNNDNSLGKKEITVPLAEKLVEANFETAFIAGVIANVLAEGTIGLFESSAYRGANEVNKPNYLKYMDENESYSTLYSGKYIYNGISLSKLKSLLQRLSNGGWVGKFGLGSVQWTASRTKTLVENFYMKETNIDTITKVQAEKAECFMVVWELTGGYKANTYDAWYSKNSSKNTEEAAYSAGSIVCLNYERPADMYAKAITRGNKAKDVYKVLMGGK